MVVLSTAKAVYAGGTTAKAVHMGTTKVWSAAPPATGRPAVVFSASGIETTTTSAVVTVPAGTAASTTFFLMRNQATGAVVCNDPGVVLLVNAALPTTNRMLVYNCDAAGKTLTFTFPACNASWFVIGMDAPRIAADAMGASGNTTSSIATPVVDVPVLADDVAVAFYGANNAVSAWTTPALAARLVAQVDMGARCHIAAGNTAALAPSSFLALPDGDRGLAGQSRIEASAVALYRRA